MQTQTDGNFWSNNRLTIKGIIVGMLILALMIPALFINELVKERSHRQQEVAREVSSKWASAQTLAGPVLVVPYREITTTTDNKTIMVKKLAYFLPDDLRINGVLEPELRYRSIFKIVVYNSEIDLQGSFPILKPGELNIATEYILWNEAQLCFGLSDFRGIEDELHVNWNNAALGFNAGLPANDNMDNGLSVAVPLSPDSINQINRFSLHLKLKGSERLYFVPVGKTTTVNFSSNWDNPAFDGNFLPDKREVSEKGFSAEWKVLHLNRNYPQSWKDAKFDLYASSFGINLLQSTDSYSKTQRSVKYAILFVALTFSLYFFIEILQKKMVHPLQYVLVGMALCVFYTLLLSIAEYLDFNHAYLIASAATIILITLYTKSIFQIWKIASVFGLVLSLLYGFIFILIQLQDGALLFGSIGLFGVLAVVMYYSRKVDWYNQANEVNPQLSV